MKTTKKLYYHNGIAYQLHELEIQKERLIGLLRLYPRHDRFVLKIRAELKEVRALLAAGKKDK